MLHKKVLSHRKDFSYKKFTSHLNKHIKNYLQNYTILMHILHQNAMFYLHK